MCVLCKKSYRLGGTRILLRGHYNPTYTSRKQPNLQWMRLPGKPGRFKVCVQCRKGSKKKAR